MLILESSNDYIEVVYTRVDNGGEDDPISPETGDNSSFLLMLGFMLVSCAGIIGFRKKILG